ncbi:hypothetical protein [Yersinia ruckeri]|nr:hypothetical protein [Yersinia ruckeri]
MNNFITGDAAVATPLMDVSEQNNSAAQQQDNKSEDKDSDDE